MNNQTKCKTVEEAVNRIKELRKSFGSDYVSVKGDHDAELIVQAKVVALGQVLDELGYSEEI